MHDTKVFIGNAAEQQCHTTWNDICYSHHLVIWLWERVQQSRMGTHGTFQLPPICALIHCYLKKNPKAAFCCFSYHLYLQSPSVCPLGTTASPLTCDNAACRFVPAKLIEFPPCGLTRHFSAESAGNKTNQRQKHYPLWKYTHPTSPPPGHLWGGAPAGRDRGCEPLERWRRQQPVIAAATLTMATRPHKWLASALFHWAETRGATLNLWHMLKKKEHGHYSCY